MNFLDKPLITLHRKDGESYRSWLARNSIPFPPVDDELLTQIHYRVSSGDLYAEIENGKYPIWFYYVRGEKTWKRSQYGPL